MSWSKHKKFIVRCNQRRVSIVLCITRKFMALKPESQEKWIFTFNKLIFAISIVVAPIQFWHFVRHLNCCIISYYWFEPNVHCHNFDICTAEQRTERWILRLRSVQAVRRKERWAELLKLVNKKSQHNLLHRSFLNRIFFFFSSLFYHNIQFVVTGSCYFQVKHTTKGMNIAQRHIVPAGG